MAKTVHIVLLSTDSVLEETLRLILREHLPGARLLRIGTLPAKKAFHSADLLIIDTDSLEAQELRELTFLQKLQPNLPIIALESIQRNSAAHSETFFAKITLQKPFDNRLLISAIKNILESDSAAH